MNFAAIPRDYPQFGKSTRNTLRRRAAVFGAQCPCVSGRRGNSCGSDCYGSCDTCKCKAQHTASTSAIERDRDAADWEMYLALKSVGFSAFARIGGEEDSRCAGWGGLYSRSSCGGSAGLAQPSRSAAAASATMPAPEGKDCFPPGSDADAACILGCLASGVLSGFGGPISAAIGAAYVLWCLRTCGGGDKPPHGCLVKVIKSDCEVAPYREGSQWCVKCDVDEKKDCVCPVGKQVKGSPCDIPLNAKPTPGCPRCKVTIEYIQAVCAPCGGAGWLV